MPTSPERDGVSVWRIEGEQHIRHTNVTTPSVSPYEMIASPERAKPRSLRMIASPERDIPCCTGTRPRSLRMIALPERDGVSVWRIEGEQHIRHTNVTTPSVSPYEKMASPERDIPCCAGTGPRSLRKDGFAGMGRAAFPTRRWLRRYRRLAIWPFAGRRGSRPLHTFWTAWQSSPTCNRDGVAAVPYTIFGMAWQLLPARIIFLYGLNSSGALNPVILALSPGIV